MSDELEDRVSKLENHAQDTNQVLIQLKSSFDSLNATVQTQMENLIQALTSVNKIDVSTLNKLVGIFGVVVIGLTTAIVFLLTGLKFNFLPAL